MQARDLHVCFSHGKESGPWGNKIAAMADVARDRGVDVESIDYRGLKNPGHRVAKLLDHLENVPGPVLLVGSSMGGHVAAAASAEVGAAGLFLLAPAFYMPGYESLTPVPRARRIAIVHGWHDDVVPAANSVRFAIAGLQSLDRLAVAEQLQDGTGTIGAFVAEELAGLAAP